jgi:hypothetical protein
VRLASRLLRLTSSTSTASDTIRDCGVTGRAKAGASEKEVRTGRNDMARRGHYTRMEEAGVWKDRKDVKLVCAELTVMLGKRLNCGVCEVSMVMTVEVD